MTRATSRNEHRPFLEAILAQPDEDGPALVYADWLEERGDAPRAEFLRAQLELARLREREEEDDEEEDRGDEGGGGGGGDGGGDRRVLAERARRERGERIETLRAREGELLRRHDAEWRAALPHREYFEWGPWVRGLPRVLSTFSIPRWIARHRALRDVAPVQWLELENPYSTKIWKLGDFHGLRPLRGLRVRCSNLNGSLVRKLLRSPHLRNIRALDFEDCRVGAEGCQTLAEHAGFENLRWLDLSGNNLPTRGLRALASAPTLRKLRTLNLRRQALDPKSLQSLTQASDWELPALRSLELQDAGLDPQALQRLLESPLAGRLRRLALLETRGESPGRPLEILRSADLPAGPRLRTLALSLRADATDPRELEETLRAPRLAKTRELILHFAGPSEGEGPPGPSARDGGAALARALTEGPRRRLRLLLEDPRLTRLRALGESRPDLVRVEPGPPGRHLLSDDFYR